MATELDDEDTESGVWIHPKKDHNHKGHFLSEHIFSHHF